MNIKKENAFPRLFCKPDTPGMLYSRHFPAIDGTICFHSLDLDQHLSVIHDWVNRWYATRFWQMNGSYHLLRSCYQCIQQHPYAHSFVGYYNGALICQVDLYAVASDELKSHIEYDQNTCGFHLLMAPNKEPVHGLTGCLLQTFLEYYFSFQQAKFMYAEPDTRNGKSIALLERTGFTRLQTVTMSYKTAHIYRLTREDFLAHHLG